MKLKIPGYYFVTLSGWFFKILTAILQLLIIKILFKNLGPEYYSQFAILAGLFPWFILSDLGLGSSLQNEISNRKASGQEYKDVIQVAFEAILCLSVALILSLFGLFYIVTRHLPQILGSGIEQRAILFFILFSSMTSLVTVLGKVYFAEKKGYVSHFLNFLCILLSYLFLHLLDGKDPKEDYIISVFIYFSSPALVGLILMSWRYIITKSKISFKNKLSLIKSIARPSKDFFLYTFVALVVLQLDYVFLAAFSDDQNILQYNALAKTFAFAFFFYNAVLQSLWPEFSEAQKKKNVIWLKKTITFNILYGFIAYICFGLIIFYFKKEILENILGFKNIFIGPSLILAFTVYYLLRIWTDIYAIYLQSTGNAQILWKVIPFQALVSFGFQFFLVPRFGAMGVVLSLIASFILTVAWFLPYASYKLIHQKNDRIVL